MGKVLGIIYRAIATHLIHKAGLKLKDDTIRPLDRPDPGLERVAKANGFSLHAGVNCEGHQKDKPAG